MKHANILQALIVLVSGAKPFLTEDERNRIGDQIKRHIELEEKAIKTYSSLLKELEDERMRLLVSYVLEDEKRHHELLLRINKMVVEAETLKEEDIWDMIWKYSVFHGTPGG